MFTTNLKPVIVVREGYIPRLSLVRKYLHSKPLLRPCFTVQVYTDSQTVLLYRSTTRPSIVLVPPHFLQFSDASKNERAKAFPLFFPQTSFKPRGHMGMGIIQVAWPQGGGENISLMNAHITVTKRMSKNWI